MENSYTHIYRKGLSPRVRGNLIFKNCGDTMRRSIPACAGEPSGAAPLLPATRVYPRVCGGTWVPATDATGATGLSPRVRGNPRPAFVRSGPVGSIPACAGEPCASPSPRPDRWVYPRVCGGTALRSYDPAPAHGLSPRVRGNRPAFVRSGPRPRSIPACAGEPLDPRCRRWYCRVYPRVCGGTALGFPPMCITRGLSPRVRGNQNAYTRVVCMKRSIPACAGEPRAGRGHGRPKWVYPRVCGGTPYCSRRATRARGLSPRVRGNPAGLRTSTAGGGSIPACAGEPRSGARYGVAPMVYPRVCGGTASPVCETGRGAGLSPRVRGNQGAGDRTPHQPGSIPACAGEPAAPPRSVQPPRVYPRVCGGTP